MFWTVISGDGSAPHIFTPEQLYSSTSLYHNYHIFNSKIFLVYWIYIPCVTLQVVVLFQRLLVQRSVKAMFAFGAQRRRDSAPWTGPVLPQRSCRRCLVTVTETWGTMGCPCYKLVYNPMKTIDI